MKKLIIVSLLIFLLFTPCYAVDILNWNEPGASGTTWPGWTFYNWDQADGTGKYGANAEVIGNAHTGWRKNDGRYQSGGATNWQIRSMGKNDYSNAGGDGCGIGHYLKNTASITMDRAPSTSSGAALRFGQDNVFGDCLSANWWFNWMDNWGNLGLATSATNRLELYAKFEGMPTREFTSTTLGSANVHFGTYLCLTGDCYNNYADGESGYGGVSTQGWHFYHYLTVNPGAWLKISLDNHPTHIRGGSWLAGNEPMGDPVVGYGGTYWELFNHGYFEIRYPQTNVAPAYITTDEWKTLTTSEEENTLSIASVWVGRWPTGRWEIGWSDLSWNNVGYNETTKSTFEVRYSTSPITNANFSAATLINPLFNIYSTSRVRRPNSWSPPAWTAFTIPSVVETGAVKIYFAIKDVSLLANGDGHDAPSSLIRTIDYDLSPVPAPDTTSPSCSAFATASTSQSLTVPISAWDCTDNVGVTGWYLSESPNAPGSTGWLSSKPTSFTVGGTGTRTIYAWVRDAADNRSAGRSSATVVTEIQAPPAPGSTKMGISGKTRLSPVGLGVLRFQ